MKRVLLATTMAALVLTWLVAAGDAPTEAGAATDVQDLIYLADSGPILIRLHVRVDGKPFQEAWDAFMTHLFHYLDVDGNGVLSQAEIDRAPRAQALLQLMRGNVFDPNLLRNRRTMELGVELVADKVKKDGLARYYRLSGVEPFLVFVRDQTAPAEALTGALFRYLDTNKDGKLSKEELLAAPMTLGKLDLNDDEVIDRDEVMPNPAGSDPNRAMMMERPEMLSEDAAFFLPAAGDSPTRLAYVLMTRYDKDKDQKLTPAEISLDQAVFEQLDRDHDGGLDPHELAKFLRCQPPLLELAVELGGAPGYAGFVYLHNPNTLLVAATGRTEHDALAVTLDRAYLDLGTSAGVAGGFHGLKQFLLQQFQAADITKRGYLDRTQGEQNPLFRELFQSADRDGDGTLTAGELTAYIDLLGQLLSSSTLLQITDHGHNLFELLDVHHSGRLRQRELHTAWTRLAIWDKNGDGQLTRDELPQQFELVFTQGQPGNLGLGNDGSIPVTTMQRPSAPVTRGPLWFRKMDRNGDGVVSLREFLGSLEDFQRIDTNGDGLISPEEAEQLDAQVRKQKEIRR